MQQDHATNPEIVTLLASLVAHGRLADEDGTALLAALTTAPDDPTEIFRLREQLDQLSGEDLISDDMLRVFASNLPAPTTAGTVLAAVYEDDSPPSSQTSSQASSQSSQHSDDHDGLEALEAQRAAEVAATLSSNPSEKSTRIGSAPSYVTTSTLGDQTLAETLGHGLTHKV